MPSDSQPEWSTTIDNAAAQSSSAPSLSDWLNKTSAAGPDAPVERSLGLDSLPSLESLTGGFSAQGMSTEPAAIEPAPAMFPAVEPIPAPFASLPTIESLTGDAMSGIPATGESPAPLAPMDSFGAGAALPSFGASAALPSFGSLPTPPSFGFDAAGSAPLAPLEPTMPPLSPMAPPSPSNDSLSFTTSLYPAGELQAPPVIPAVLPLAPTPEATGPAAFTAPSFTFGQPLPSIDATPSALGALPPIGSFAPAVDSPVLSPASFGNLEAAPALPSLSPPEAQQNVSSDEPSDTSAAVWNPYPAAEPSDGSGWEPVAPAALPSGDQFGSHFHLRDEGGFSTPPFTTAPEPTVEAAQEPGKEKARRGLAGKFGRAGKETEPNPFNGSTEGDVPSANEVKAKKVKAEKAPKAEKTPKAEKATKPKKSDAAPNAEAALAAMSGDNGAGAGKLSGLFKKAEPKAVDLEGAADVDDDSQDTARLVRILASLCLAAGLLLGAYTIFSTSDAPDVVPQAPTATTPVPDVGLAPAVPTADPTVDPALVPAAGDVTTQDPAAPATTVPAEDGSLDFSDGSDFTTGQDFSVPVS